MAASVVVQLQQAYGENCLKIELVDPANAACWYDSLKAGEPRAVGGLAGFIAVAYDQAAREKLGIDGGSRLMFFSTEGGNRQGCLSKCRW